MQLVGVRVLPVEVLAHGFGGKLRLTDVTEIPGQVDRFTWGEKLVRLWWMEINMEQQQAAEDEYRFDSVTHICRISVLQLTV